MSRSRSQRAMSPTSPRPAGPSKRTTVLRPKALDLMSRSEPSLPLSSISRRQSKGGLRDLFSKNRSTRTLAATLERDETSPRSSTTVAPTENLDSSWLPPPLFQAYPQSVKHVNLEASTLSAQSIIRMSEQRSANLVRSTDQNTLAVPADSALATRRPRRGSTSIANAEWTRKVYVLTTSGHLLQYTGEGAFDRKPEKILQLGKDSAAFASDAIEGRHFVLHVSQSCSDDGETDLDSSKGIFSRIGIKTPSARRSAKVLFMVFDTPVEFDSWLIVLRKMIGSLGGRPYSPETLVVETSPASPSTINQRYLVQKDPYQFSRDVSPAISTDTATEERPSTQSSTYTATDLERLRDSKTSNTSAVTGIATSVLGSPPSSPLQEKFTLTEVPQLELPDLGPTSLVDFSQHGKRNSRLSLIFPDFKRRTSVDVEPKPRYSRKDLLRSQLTPRKISVPEKEQSEEPSLADSQEKTQDQGHEASEEQDAQEKERPLSTLAPLPTSFSLRHTSPDLPSTHRYSRQFPISSDSSTNLPKRYSSLDYSRSLIQSHLPLSGASKPSLPQKNLRRPTSMQLRTEPLSSTHFPTRSPSLRIFSPECASSAGSAEESGLDTLQSAKQSQSNVNSAFGPPAGPPPSCPLPAVPPDALPLRRQSLAARELVLSGSWGEEPPEFF
jgi:hypothetical protein